MRFTREDGRYFYAECEKCGNELKAMRAHCKKSTYEFEVNRAITCSCGEISKIIYLPQLEKHLKIELINKEGVYLRDEKYTPHYKGEILETYIGKVKYFDDSEEKFIDGRLQLEDYSAFIEFDDGSAIQKVIIPDDSIYSVNIEVTEYYNYVKIVDDKESTGDQ